MNQTRRLRCWSAMIPNNLLLNWLERNLSSITYISHVQPGLIGHPVYVVFVWHITFVTVRYSTDFFDEILCFFDTCNDWLTSKQYRIEEEEKCEKWHFPEANMFLVLFSIIAILLLYVSRKFDKNILPFTLPFQFSKGQNGRSNSLTTSRCLNSLNLF